MAVHGGLVYLSQASGSNLLLAKPDGTASRAVPLASSGGANPQGIAFVGEKAYVALAGTDEVVVVDVAGAAACLAGQPGAACPTVQKRISVAALASPGASAMPSRLAVDGQRLYATLWNFDAFFAVPPSSTGRLAVIDTRLDALDATVSSGGIAGLLDLGAGCLDPADLAVQGRTLWVSCGFTDYSGYPAPPVVRGAGVARLDLDRPTSTQLALLPAATTSTSPGRLAFCGGQGYLADNNSGTVYLLDSASGTHGGAELCPPKNGFAFVADLRCGSSTTP
jgi:DNA-binding beta-propeller fold protein YncE